MVVLNAVKEAVTTIAAVAILLLSVMILYSIISQVSSRTYVISEIETPDQLAKQGYTATVVARHLSDVSSDIVSAGEKGWDIARPRSGLEVLKKFEVELPNSGLTIQTAAAYFRDLFDYSDYQINGEIVANGSEYIFILRREDRRIVYESVPKGDSSDIAKLIRLGGVKLIETIDPYLAAVYYLSEDRVTRNFTNTQRMIELLSRNRTEEYWSHNLLCVMERDRGLLQQSITACEKAIIVDQSQWSAYANLGYSLYLRYRTSRTSEDCQNAISHFKKVFSNRDIPTQIETAWQACCQITSSDSCPPK